MEKVTAALFILIVSPFLSLGQTSDKIANEAFVLTRMVNKFHVQPKPVNSNFSRDLFKDMLYKTDEGRMFFNANDIQKLKPYATTLDQEIKQRKTGYLNLFISLYQQRLHQADSLIDEIGKKPFNFYSTDKFTVAEDTLYPQSLAAMQVKLYKKMEIDAIDELADDLPANFKSFTPAKQKKYIDSAEVILRKKAVASSKRKINSILHNTYGITQYVGNIYCETIASCFDPHTEFFPPEDKENFESELGKQPFQFGFRIKSDKNGGVLISNLQPGSPAFKSGKLNKGDKFIRLQWDGGQPVDVSDISIHEFRLLLEESNHKKMLFTVKKTDGSVAQVSLEKEQTAGYDDDNKVKSFILKGENNVGYIYLPAFYEDWVNQDEGLNGCANDVGREILKLKKENISGLILDLRYNGGGSVHEATELAGIFIDAGPVAQEKNKDSKVRALKDIDRGTVYDGPLVILVNGYSASASELVAGALQDYNRAVIIGAPTYGKATTQVVLPMDTTATYENARQIFTENDLKITVSKLYRVNGTTAQFKGVQPDIVLPDILDAYITKEADEHYAFPPTVIDANKYYAPYSPLPITTLAQGVQKEIDTDRYFNAVKKFITYSKQKSAEKEVSLNLKDWLTDLNESAGDIEALSGVTSKKYKVQNNQYEMAMLQADENLKELNEEFTQRIAIDAFVKIAYDVLSKLKNH
ncbi:MAG TPA: S41 family peptidase [Mucilaginibacter sp.]